VSVRDSRQTDSSSTCVPDKCFIGHEVKAGFAAPQAAGWEQWFALPTNWYAGHGGSRHGHAHVGKVQTEIQQSGRSLSCNKGLCKLTCVLLSVRSSSDRACSDACSDTCEQSIEVAAADCQCVGSGSGQSLLAGGDLRPRSQAMKQL
jgi:hypothetical protein